MKGPAVVTRLLKLEHLVAYLLANLGILQQVKIVSIQGDYLVVNPIDPDGVANTGVEKNVAKPYLLRRTPFDGGSRNGISYTYTSNVQRTADDGVDTETQVIVPSYAVGDLLLVRRALPNAQVSVGGVSLSLVDMNNDGRAWAEETA